MEPPIPLVDARYDLESQLRDCYGRVAYSHKTHEKMAERDASRLRRSKWATIILSALTTGGAVGVFFDKTSLVASIATALLATASLIFNSYMKDLDPGASAQRHREIASKLWNVREAYLSLLTDIRDRAVTLEALRKRRDQVQGELRKIYTSAPHTDAKAYGEAQDALKKNAATVPGTLSSGNCH